MLTIRRLDGPADWPGITAHVPIKQVQDTMGFVACAENGDLKGAIVFDNFLANCAQATIWLETSFVLRSTLLKDALDFVFGALNLERLYLMVASNNSKSLRLATKLGAIEQMRMPDAYARGVDFLVMSLHRDEVELLRAA